MIARRNIGTTDIEVTELSFGGAPLGAVGDRITDDQAAAIMRRAREGGIRYFDTAPLYGHGLSEKRLGRVLRELPRDDFVLSTKVGRLLVPRSEGERFEGMRDAEPVAIRYDYSFDAVRRSLEASLERLGLDRVDILLCHDIDIWTHGDAQPGIYEAAKNGRCRRWPNSASRASYAHRARRQRMAGMQPGDGSDAGGLLPAGRRFTLLEQEPLDEFLPKCREHRVSIIIGGPYNSGILATDERRFATYDYKPAPEHLWQRAQAIRRMCESHGVDPRAAALQYPLRHPAVAAVIPGVRMIDELDTNLRLFATEIPDALWRDLADAELARAID